MKGLSFAAKTGLPILAQALSAESAGAESIEDSPNGLSGLSSADLAKRAIASEAALQALMKLPPHRLEEEGFFDNIVNVVKKIAPVVIKVAPSVISNLSPTVGRLLKASTDQNTRSAKVRNSSQPAANNRMKSQPALRKKDSTSNFLGKLESSRALVNA